MENLLQAGNEDTVNKLERAISYLDAQRLEAANGELRNADTGYVTYETLEEAQDILIDAQDAVTALRKTV